MHQQLAVQTNFQCLEYIWWSIRSHLCFLMPLKFMTKLYKYIALGHWLYPCCVASSSWYKKLIHQYCWSYNIRMSLDSQYFLHHQIHKSQIMYFNHSYLTKWNFISWSISLLLMLYGYEFELAFARELFFLSTSIPKDNYLDAVTNLSFPNDFQKLNSNFCVSQLSMEWWKAKWSNRRIS